MPDIQSLGGTHKHSFTRKVNFAFRKGYQLYSSQSRSIQFLLLVALLIIVVTPTMLVSKLLSHASSTDSVRVEAELGALNNAAVGSDPNASPLNGINNYVLFGSSTAAVLPQLPGKYNGMENHHMALSGLHNQLGMEGRNTQVLGVTNGISVSGNRLVDGSGNTVVLHGVDRSGAEYACIQGWGVWDNDGGSTPGDTPTNDDAQVPLIRNWGANAVLIGLNEDCWLNVNTSGLNQAYLGTNYINAIKHEVATVESYGMYPIISMFWTAPGTTKATDLSPMPNNDHTAAAWQSIANTFKGDPNVIFRLLEEPYPASASDTTATWDCWSKGDVQYGVSATLTPISQTKNCSESFTTVGMQSLVNIIRGAGANNVIALSGTGYSNYMTHFLDSGIRVTDPLANPQLTGAVDVYPDGKSSSDTSACHDTTCYSTYYAPVINVMPFFAGEFGESVNGDVCSTTGIDTLMNWFNQHGAGYVAWTWDAWGTTCGDLSLILNYTNGSPHSPNGTDYQARLASLGSNVTPTSTPALPTATPKPTNTPTATPTSGCPVSIPSGTGTDTMQFTAPSTGNYLVWLRMMVPISGNSLYYQLNTPGSCAVMVTDSTGVNSWDWITQGTASLTAGATYSITVTGNQAGVKLDQVLLSQSCTPTGDGSNCIVSPTVVPSPTTALPTNTPTPGVSDTQAPSITSFTLANTQTGALVTTGTVSRKINYTLTASAQDNVGVAKVVFSINTSTLCTDITAPYSCTWSVGGKPNASYTLKAVAYDAVGNTSVPVTTTVTSH